MNEPPFIPVNISAAASQDTPPVDPLLVTRYESWRVDVLGLNDQPLGTLDGVSAGSFDFNVSRPIRGNGSLSCDLSSSTPDWHRVRIQPWYVLSDQDGRELVSWPVGVFLPATPTAAYADPGASAEVDLYDKLLILQDDKTTGPFGLPAGTVVTEAVRDVILSTGQTRVLVVDSDETLAAPMVWPPATPKLQIVNELLDAINYFAIRVDGYGVFRADPYVAPADRGVAWTFTDDHHGITAAPFTLEADGFSVPNRVVLTTAGDGEAEGLVGVAEITDPDSPWSYEQRGRWVTYEPNEPVEATSQAVIDAMATRRLADLTRVTSTLAISHAHIPLELNDVCAFTRTDAGVLIPAAVVQTMRVSMDLGAPVQTTLRQVVAT